MAKNDKDQTVQPSTSDQTPPAPGSTTEDPEAKQGVIRSSDTASNRPKRWKVPGFRGSYKGVAFNEEGESDAPVSAAVAAEFRAQYPDAQITEIE